jgi:hypothetical protein
MQNGDSSPEYRRIKAEFEKIQKQRKLDAEKPSPPKQRVTPNPATKHLEARFTVTQGLLIAFLTLILWDERD